MNFRHTYSLIAKQCSASSQFHSCAASSLLRGYGQAKFLGVKWARSISDIIPIVNNDVKIN